MTEGLGSGFMRVPGAFARAFTMAERQAHAMGAAGARDASGRLALWRRQPPFDRGHWWHARLSADGLSEARLLDFLGEPEADLAARIPGPAWAQSFTAAMLEPGGGREGAKPDGALFAQVVAPLLAAGRARLLERLRALAGSGSGTCPFDPDALTGQLYEPLPLAMHRMLVRTLVLELHRSRAAGELRGDDGAQRFTWFVTALREDAGRQRALFTEYPVLARQLAVDVEAWVGASERFAVHLAADAAAIGSALAGGRRLGAPVRVLTGLGDRHRGGTTVARVCWPDGTEVIYKPRPMQVDVHFQQLVGWVNGHGGPGLRLVGCLGRGDHGWMECVTAAPCPDGPARRRFYRRQGGLLALLYVLGACDFHAENLIAAGDDPVLIDLETLLQPGLPVATATLTSADIAAAEAARESVMAAGLLPHRSWISPSGDAVDLSGLGYRPGQQSPLAVATVRDAGLDTMRLELGPVPMGTPEHRPAREDSPLRLLDYGPDIIDGFTEVYQLCSRHASELAAGPLAAFAGDEVRVLIRPTLWYATVLNVAFHPDLLRDALDRERHFDALWRDVPDSPHLAACIRHERADLWRNDIPVFTTTAGESVLYGADGYEVEGFRLLPAIERARARLAALSDADLARQRWLITGALGTSAIGAIITAAEPPGEQSLAVAPPPAGQATPATTSRAQLLEAADAVGVRLAQLGFRADGSAQWLGVNSPRGTTWSMGPLRPDLFHGLTGVALFLGWLGQITGEARHTVLARQALVTARRQLEHSEPERFGGMAGIGGLTYGLAELGKLWSDESLIDTAERHALAATAHAGSDMLYDFVSGSAGTIAGLAALHRIRPSSALEAGIQACADRLMHTAIRTETGIGWLSDAVRRSAGATLPIAGFAHGNAGTIVALYQAAEILGSQAHRDAARDALSYEQALFDPGSGTWSDLRDPRMLAEWGKTGPRAYWCHGGVGIGLSRLRSLRYMERTPIALREIDAALNMLSSQPRASHCLCHGDLGNTELYLDGAQTLTRPDLLREARQRGLDTIAAISRTGWKCGMALNVETVGLMFGLAGIGYGMLRLIDPDRVPAVLTLSFSEAGR